jgi:hypothetical protein
MTIWNNMRPFGIVRGHLVYFSHFGMFGPRKIWQPCSVFLMLPPVVASWASRKRRKSATFKTSDCLQSGLLFFSTKMLCKKCRRIQGPMLWFRTHFRRKLAKIAENCYHNIDPWTGCLCNRWCQYVVVACYIAKSFGCFLDTISMMSSAKVGGKSKYLFMYTKN